MPIELADKFGRTFFDYWRLAPGRFLEAQRSEPEKYLPPYQFLCVCLTLSFSMLLIEFGLIDGVLLEITGHKPAAEPMARAGRLLILLVSITAISSLFVSFASRPWPIRRRVPVRTIFEFMSFAQAALMIPAAAFDTLVMPIIGELALREIIPSWTIWIPMVIGLLGGITIYFVYVLPGLAILARTSRSRMFWGLTFWSFVLTFVPSFLIGIWVGITRAV